LCNAVALLHLSDPGCFPRRPSRLPTYQFQCDRPHRLLNLTQQHSHPQCTDKALAPIRPEATGSTRVGARARIRPILTSPDLPILAPGAGHGSNRARSHRRRCRRFLRSRASLRFPPRTRNGFDLAWAHLSRHGDLASRCSEQRYRNADAARDCRTRTRIGTAGTAPSPSSDLPCIH
jgi:hypothetical protein